MADYNGFFVDEKYSDQVLTELFNDALFVQGVTYSAKYNGDVKAGAVQISKLTKGTVKTDGSGITSRTTPTAIANTLITLPLDKPFFLDKDIPQVTINSVSYNLVQETMNNIAKAVREKWEEVAAQALADGVTKINAAALTDTTIYADLIESRKAIRDAGAKPNVIITSTAIYALILQSPEFIKASDLGDRIQATGAVGTIFGMLVFEYQGLGTVGADTIQYIMYDFNTFAIANNLNQAEVVKGIAGFAGITAQVGINSGFKVVEALEGVVRTVS